MWKDASHSFFPTSPRFFFVSFTDAVVTGPGLQLELKIGIILTKKYNRVSDLYVIITKSLLGQDSTY